MITKRIVSFEWFIVQPSTWLDLDLELDASKNSCSKILSIIWKLVKIRLEKISKLKATSVQSIYQQFNVLGGIQGNLRALMG